MPAPLLGPIMTGMVSRGEDRLCQESSLAERIGPRTSVPDAAVRRGDAVTFRESRRLLTQGLPASPGAAGQGLNGLEGLRRRRVGGRVVRRRGGGPPRTRWLQI